MDRLTAGAEGERLDRAMGDYRAEVGNSIISEDPAAYGEITDAEQGRMDAARAEFDESLGAFRAAKQRVADVAAAVVSVVITLLVTIFTAGTATGPLVVILLGAATGAAAGAGSALTREAILGSGYELGREGVQEVITQAATGALTAGAQFYAGALLRSMTGAATAAQQLTSIGAAALTRPPLWQRLGAEMLEEAVQTGIEGTVEAGAAAIDPTHWMHGWSEGWRRGREAGLTRLAQVPADAARAAAVAGLTQLGMEGAGAARDRIRRARRGPVDDATRAAEEAAELRAREAGEDATTATRRGTADATTDARTPTPTAEADAAAEIAAEAGPRASLGARARHIGGEALGGIGESAVEGVAELAVTEETWRAEGMEARAILGSIGQSILDGFKDVAAETHVSDANVARRSRSGAVHLAREGHRLTASERHAYIHAVVHAEDAGSTAMSVGIFLATRSAAIDAAVRRHESRLRTPLTQAQRDAFGVHVRGATTDAEFQARLQADPTTVPSVAGADAEAARRADAVRRAEEERNPGPAVTQLLGQLGAAITHSTASQETAASAATEARRQSDLASAAMSAIPAGRGGAQLTVAIAAVHRASDAYSRVIGAQTALVEAHRDLSNARTRLQAALDILNNASVTPDQQASARAELTAALRAQTAELARVQQAEASAIAEANAGLADARAAAAEAQAAQRQASATAPPSATATVPASTVPASSGGTTATPTTATPSTATPSTATPSTATPSTVPPDRNDRDAFDHIDAPTATATATPTARPRPRPRRRPHRPRPRHRRRPRPRPRPIDRDCNREHASGCDRSDD